MTVLSLFVFSFHSKGQLWEGLAQFSSTVFLENCPDITCQSAENQPAAELIELNNALSEDLYFKELAELRQSRQKCAIDHLTGFMLPEGVEQLKQQALEKLKIATQIEVELWQLSRGTGEGGRLDSDKIKQLEAAKDIALASLPMAEQAEFRNLYRATLDNWTTSRVRIAATSLTPSPKELELKPYEIESLAGALNLATENTYVGLSQDLRQLEPLIQSEGQGDHRAIYETLAQDDELVRGYLLSRAQSDRLEAVACQADRKYGGGAKLRDNILQGTALASVVATGGVGLAARGASLGRLGSAVVARSLMPSRAVSTLRILGSLSGGAALVESIAQQCLQPNIQRAQLWQGCEEFSFEALDHSKCVTDTALAALGAGTAAPKGLSWAANQLVTRSTSPAVSTAAASLDAAQEIDRAADWSRRRGLGSFAPWDNRTAPKGAGGLAEETTSSTILRIAPGQERGATREILQHEVRHARSFKNHHARTIGRLDGASTWSLTRIVGDGFSGSPLYRNSAGQGDYVLDEIAAYYAGARRARLDQRVGQTNRPSRGRGQRRQQSTANQIVSPQLPREFLDHSAKTIDAAIEQLRTGQPAISVSPGVYANDSVVTVSNVLLKADFERKSQVTAPRAGAGQQTSMNFTFLEPGEKASVQLRTVTNRTPAETDPERLRQFVLRELEMQREQIRQYRRAYDQFEQAR